MLDRRIIRSLLLGGVGWVDSYIGKEGLLLDYRSVVEFKIVIVSYYRKIIRYWLGWVNNFFDVGD